MERRDAVDGVAADDGEVRHAHALLAVLLDDRHAPAARSSSAPKRGRTSSRKRAVDLVDDLEVPGQQPPNRLTGQRSSASGRRVWFV